MKMMILCGMIVSSILAVQASERVIIDEEFRKINNWQHPREAKHFFAGEKGYITPKRSK